MADKIQPVICTAQEIADYQGILLTEANSPIKANAAITGIQWLQKLADWSAWMIVNFTGRDYTAAQVFHLYFRGNNHDSIIKLPEPVSAFTVFKAWNDDGTLFSPAPVLVDLIIGPTPAMEASWVYGPFRSDIRYYIEYTRATTGYPDAITGWPPSIKLAQIEFCAWIYKESGNGEQFLGMATIEAFNDQRIPQQVRDMIARLRSQLQQYRKILP